MITKFLGMQEDADEFRIAFQDDKGHGLVTSGSSVP